MVTYMCRNGSIGLLLLKVQSIHKHHQSFGRVGLLIVRQPTKIGDSFELSPTERTFSYERVKSSSGVAIMAQVPCRRHVLLHVEPAAVVASASLRRQASRRATTTRWILTIRSCRICQP